MAGVGNSSELDVEKLLLIHRVSMCRAGEKAQHAAGCVWALFVLGLMIIHINYQHLFGGVSV